MTRNITTLTIAPNASNSSAAQLQAALPVKLLLPASLTGSTMLFDISMDGGTTWYRLYYGGADYSVPVAASKAVPINSAIFQGADSLRVVSGSTELAERLIHVVTEGE